jgi:hypothetical protein
MHPPDPPAITRRAALVAAIAGKTALAGCNGLGPGGFTFPDGTPTERQQEIAQTFVTRVHDGAYEAATDSFTTELADSLPPDRIERVWADTVGDLGPFAAIGAWGVRSGETGDAVFARVECANGYYALQVTIVDERIAGVFIRNVVRE